MGTALARLKNLTDKFSSYEFARKENMKRLEDLYKDLSIDLKVENFTDLFDFKAINLSGISLQEDSLGLIKKGKYLQILAISYDKNAKVKSKNISLAYLGRVENVEDSLREEVVEFVIRYRFEKSFINLEHYHTMIGSVSKKDV